MAHTCREDPTAICYNRHLDYSENSEGDLQRKYVPSEQVCERK